jgi:hypothetical protein
MPKRLQYKRSIRLPENAIYVGRPSPFGNPFQIIKTGSSWHVVGPNTHALPAPTKPEARAIAVKLYSEWLAKPEQAALRIRIAKELVGHDVACWCPLDGLPCHGDLLLEMARA